MRSRNSISTYINCVLPALPPDISSYDEKYGCSNPVSCPDGFTCVGMKDAAQACKHLDREYLADRADTGCFGFMKPKESGPDTPFMMCPLGIRDLGVEGQTWNV